nr:NAD(P)-dependent oxidoreductase [Actinomycetota bacterium]
MTTIGIVSPGAMGSAVGAAYVAGGTRVVATVSDRSVRTRELAAAAGLELLADLDEVVRHADIVLSIVPPEQAPAVAADIGAAARRADADPLVVDLNAIAPATARGLELRLAGSGLDVVDGSISGGPPHAAGSTRFYLS